ncbi:uncharacterized protein si:ch211-126c2.4 isoform X2 [Ctenopharyngodon idella]|uniref:uncharacterized protein si:ch211-126c2.4 isoform X2 n=1 Tax=Ctenopharyngodon idella TaxID=7959 RepID=UPI002232C5D9|nr:uncharacterized protein si:ch211-126c2.4 isoform X2 [Ctenopharyngodon idella]
MESFLRRKLAQAGGNVLGGPTLQKPISSYQAIKLPDLCSSFYSIADEPFPQVSGFLDDTVGPSFLLNETGTVLNSPACTPSENQTKNKDDSVFNHSLGAPCQLADGSVSTRSLQNEKDISAAADKADGHCNDPTVSTTSLEKSDFMSAELKNSTFDVTQDLKERSDTGGNMTVDLHNIREKNSTFESQESKERFDPNSTVDIDVPNIKAESGNTTVDLVQSHDLKESPDNGVNETVDIPNIDSTHSKSNSSDDNNAPLNTTTEQLNEKLEGTIDIQPEEKPNGSLNSTEDDKIKNTEEANLKVNVTVDVVEQMASAPHQPSGEIEQSSSDILKPAETEFTKHNATTDFTPPEVPVLKDTAVEIKPPSTELADQVNGASNSVEITKPVSNSRETEVEISTSAFVCSVDAPNDAPELKAEEHHKTTERPGLAEVESVPSSDISRNSIFCLDDTLDLKTSFMVTSTPIVFGKESRFEILRDAKPTPMRKRLSVINSIEAQSNDELVGVSNHNGTDTVQVTESSGQKVSVNCTSSHSTSEPANENKPPTKLPIKRQLPQLSSKLSYPKSSLPPRPQSSMSSSVVVKPKTIQGSQAPHHPDTSSTTLLGKRDTVQMNKGKNIAPVKNTASASTVKTSMVSSVTGYNFTAVAKPSSSGGIPQVKQSGLKPPTRKRMALKTSQTTRSSVEPIQTQSCNKPTTALPAHAALSTVESDAVHPAESGCVNCLQHQEKLERILQELMSLRSECTNWGPLHEKLEMCVREMKRI